MHCNNPELIVMLTYNDRTVANCHSIFGECKNSNAKFWGIKENGISFMQMKNLYTFMKEYGKTTVLEVTAYEEKECVRCAKIAVECGCDILMGTKFFDSVNELCKENNLKYMPFVGNVKNRPSVLEGSVEDMIDEANACLEQGVYGFDLLGYRYVGNAVALNKKFLAQVNAPVCLAGSINSYERLDEVKNFSPWAFTIGGAFFENKFGRNYNQQINRVCKHIKPSEILIADSVELARV